MLAQRQELLAALADCAHGPFRQEARRFLGGLSADEMQFIAEFMGARILACPAPCTREIRLRRAPDRDHKLLVLLEYLQRSGWQRAPGAALAASRHAAS